jgi:hypothetical protein
MNPIKRFFWLFLVALSVLWWWTDTTDWAALPHIFAWRAVLMQYSGVLGISVMSVAMVPGRPPGMVRVHPRWA